MSDVLYDHNSERAVLGCMLSDSRCIGDMKARMKASMFHDPKHRIIFENIMKLYASGVEADICSLSTVLMEGGLLEQAGGAAYIAELTNEVAGASGAAFYMENVIRHAQSRELKAALSSEVENIGTKDNAEIMKDIEDRVFRISASTTTTKIWTGEELATEYNGFIKYSEETWGTEKGIKVGFPTLDRMTDGFQPEDVIVIGARPSIGKTALAISMMQNLMERDIPCGFISAEMSQHQIMTRMISQWTRIDGTTIRSGRYTEEMKRRLFEATHYYATRKLYIDDTANITLDALVSSARHMRIHHGVQIIFIDYIGLIGVGGDAPVWEKVSDISRALKSLARELKIPIVALSQLGREAEGNSPNLANIRGSGSVEQDADLVILLNGERDLFCYTSSSPFLERDLTLAKHRNGPCGKVYLDFEKEFTTFTEAEDQKERAEKDMLKGLSPKERMEYLSQKDDLDSGTDGQEGGR